MFVSLKDQIETLKSEIHFLREEVRDKNSIIKHLINFQSLNSAKNNLDIILEELNKSKEERSYCNLNHNCKHPANIPNQQQNMIRSNNDEYKNLDKVNTDNTDDIKQNDNNLNKNKNNENTCRNPFSCTPSNFTDSQISPSVNPFSSPYKSINKSDITEYDKTDIDKQKVRSNEADDNNESRDITNKDNNKNVATLNPTPNCDSNKTSSNMDGSSKSNPGNPFINEDDTSKTSERKNNYTKVDENNKNKEEDIDEINKGQDQEKKSIYIVGDSMVKELRGYELAKSIKHKKKVKVRTHPSAKTSCLSDHLKPVMRSDNCEHIIIHIGTNDLRSERTPVQISHDIINLAYAVRESQIKVSVSGLIQRNDDLNEKVLSVNDILAKTCGSIDIPFISHKNIRPDIHLNASKLHLNKKGNSILIANFRKYLGYLN